MGRKVNREKQGPFFCPSVATLPSPPHLFPLGLSINKWEQDLNSPINLEGPPSQDWKAHQRSPCSPQGSLPTIQLVLSSYLQPVSSTCIPDSSSPNRNSPFLLPLPSLSCKFLPHMPLGRRRACLISVLKLCSCVDWRKQSAESLEERQKKSDSVLPHEDPFSTCPSWHTMTCPRMSPCLHHPCCSPTPIRMARHRSPGHYPIPRKDRFMEFPTRP